MRTLVFGHKNPDTDSTAAALAYAWFLGESAEAVLLGEPNRETRAMLELVGIATPRVITDVPGECNVAVIDTNNPDELIAFPSEQLVSIVDHHKLTGGLHTAEPILVRIEPVGCTCTVIWNMMLEKGVEPTVAIASVMAAAIISDTINLTGPTTTQADRDALAKLVVIAGLDQQEFADRLFTAKSDLTGIDPAELIVMDSKQYVLAGHVIQVSVLETVKPEVALQFAPALREAMLAYKQAEGVTEFPLFIVDLIKQVSYLIIADERDEALFTKAFSTPIVDGLITLPGVVSRKKQMVPPIEAALV